MDFRGNVCYSFQKAHDLGLLDNDFPVLLLRHDWFPKKPGEGFIGFLADLRIMTGLPELFQLTALRIAIHKVKSPVRVCGYDLEL